MREFIEMCFGEVDMEIEWGGESVDEKGCNKATGEVLVEVDPAYFRPTEVDLLIGDYSKAKEVLGWEPEYQLQDLIKEMMESDLKLFERDRYLKEGGHNTLNYHE